MRLLFRRLIIVAVLFGILSGCATTGTTTDSGSIGSDATRTKAEGTAFGALIGAALGAGVGALVDGSDGALKGAMIGGGVGAVAGYIGGKTVAERKQQYVNEEDRLNGEINVVTKYNNELKILISQTASKIKDLELQVSTLKSRYQKGEIQAGALKKKRGEINALIHDVDNRKNSMNKELLALDEYQQSIKKTQNQANVAKLKQEIDILKKNIAMLDTSNIRMAKLAQSLPVRN